MSEKIQTKIGGQAVIEGVMMRGATSMALSVRTDEGLVLTSTERIAQRKRIRKIPIIRGIFSFASSIYVGMKTLTKSADMASGEVEKPTKAAYAFSIFAAIIISLGIFFFLPSLFGDFFYNKLFSSVLLKNLVSGVLRVALFIAYLFLVSLLKDMKRVFGYHGAEHKTINCFESGKELTIENVKSCSCRHNRCGTTFLFLVMLISILVFAFVDYGLYLFVPLDGYARTFTYMGIKLLFLPLVAGVSYEALFLLARLKDNLFVRILRFPGLALQALTTAEPDEKMIEVAIKSFSEVLRMDEDPSIEPREYDKIPILSAYEMINGVLDELNAERAEADWMLCHILHCRRGELPLKKYLSLNDYKKLGALIEERRTKPLDYCFKTSNFCGYDVFVDERALIPRAETEILAAKAVEIINEKNISCVLELCTGSGCISLVLSKQTNAAITASDISQRALEVAQKNLQGLNIRLVKSDLFTNLEGEKFDMIVANPPYIASIDIDSLQFEVKCQPHIALDGGEDGLSFYRRIIGKAQEHLNNDGFILLELGIGQWQAVKEMLQVAGFKGIEVTKDFGGIERVIKANI